MVTLTIRRIDKETMKKLRTQAADHRRSMEEEAREILRSSLTDPGEPTEDLATAIRRLFAPLGGVELKLPKRTPIPEPIDFAD